MGLAIAVNEILWYSAVGFETVDTVLTTILKISVLVTTFVSLFFLYKYYDGQLEVFFFSPLFFHPFLFVFHNLVDDFL